MKKLKQLNVKIVGVNFLKFVLDQYHWEFQDICRNINTCKKVSNKENKEKTSNDNDLEQILPLKSKYKY